MFLIIQNGFRPTNIHRYLTVKYEIIKSSDDDVSKLQIDKYALIIILGGDQSITKIESYPYLVGVICLIQKCLKIKKPLLGICLGCQLIAYTLGCEIKSCNKLNSGFDVNILNFKNVFRYHYDYIVPNDSLNVIEWFDNMPYLYTYCDNVVGIQCHPDMLPELVNLYTDDPLILDFAISHEDELNDTNTQFIDYLIAMIYKKIDK